MANAYHFKRGESKCGDCDYLHNSKTDHNRCRRYPPQVIYSSDGKDHVWPIVFDDEWCAEFKPICMEDGKVRK